jgi:hypothetical protein
VRFGQRIERRRDGVADDLRNQIGKNAHHPPRAAEALLPERRVEGGDLDLASAPRRMDEAVVAKIDTDVREREVARVEEHEVAGFEIRNRDLLTQPAHVLCRTRESDARDFLETHSGRRPLQSRPVAGVLPPHL